MTINLEANTKMKYLEILSIFYNQHGSSRMEYVILALKNYIFIKEFSCPGQQDHTTAKQGMSKVKCI